MIRLLGLGNAITDVHVSIESDDMLLELGLPKGSMQLIDSARFEMIHDKMQGSIMQVSCGGSAANTITGASKLGVPSAFIGKVHSDEIGQMYRKDMESYDVKTLLLHDSDASGQAFAFVSSDGERTFATYLGAAANLQPDDLKSEDFVGHDVLYLEGYLVQNQALVLRAVELAKLNGLKVALDLASYNVVDANRHFLTDLIEKSVDMVFANEEEAKSLTGLEPHSAVGFLSEKCEIAIVKIGAEGALAQKGDRCVHLPATPANKVDTTGAGDLFAAGFLYGMHLGKDLHECTRYGTVTAGKVIEVIGPKMQPETWLEIQSLF